MSNHTDLVAVARCCRVSAAMLRLADSGEPDNKKRTAYGKANEGQAELLEKAADLADQVAARVAT